MPSSNEAPYATNMASAGGQGRSVPVGGAIPEVSAKKLRQVLWASIIGTVIEWYDFVLFAVASGLVFNKLFFPELSPVAGTLASFLTLAVGFLARPLGGLIISHFGDKKGRKPALVFTIALMGLATVITGSLPTFQQIGILAPILLAILRLLQGLGAGAEYAGALILVAEYVPEKKKGYYTAFVLSATVVGLLLASTTFRLVSQLPQDTFMSWGWRVPFWISAALVVVALYIRMHLEETPEYRVAVARAAERERASKLPLGEVLRKQPKALLCGYLAMCGANAGTYTLNTFALAYMVNRLGFPRADALNVLILAAIAGIVCTPIMGAISDRYGHAKVYLLGTLFILLYAAPMFWLMDSRSIMLAGVAMVIGYGIGFGSVAGSQGAFLTNLFPTRYRYTGIAFVREINGATIAGLTPFIATWLTQLNGGKSNYVVAYLVIMCLVSIIAVWAIRHEKPQEA
ncbi:MHS family MFS transporter [Candidimonas humi]|uniref:MFS transporter n=1 Tax=Candidimonas humi TaxID=683355 RepID=A0ABV8P1Z0_9BURK|nr:MFS transporter [Candidimonas humi]MBV6306951.1 MHS family MFS transporter [Candidimonas humi]